MIDRAPFGRTGHESSRVLFGAAALWAMTQDRADALLPLLREAGVNHLDVAASYGDAELRLAPWLERHRDDFFLATKTDQRTADGARAQLEASLERLGVDSVDLIQLHNLVEADEWELAHGPGGALEAMVRARDEGLVRFIGVTGHGTRIAGRHLASLERFGYDSVLLPWNIALSRDDGYRADVERLLAVCAERSVAVQLIKSVARRHQRRPRRWWRWCRHARGTTAAAGTGRARSTISHAGGTSVRAADHTSSLTEGWANTSPPPSLTRCTRPSERSITVKRMSNGSPGSSSSGTPTGSISSRVMAFGTAPL